MKITVIFSIILVLSTIWLIRLAIKAFISGEENAREMSSVLFWSALTTAMHSLIVVTHNFNTASHAMAVFFIALDWVLFSLVRFTMKFTGQGLKRRGFVWALIAITAADSLQLLFNPLTGFAFGGYFPNLITPLIVVHRTGYYLHLIWSYILLAIVVVLLIRKLLHTSKMYARRYTIFLYILMGLAAWDVLYVFFKTSVDISVFGFPVAGSLVYYFAFRYVPGEVKTVLLSRVVTELRDGIIFFDNENRCIYHNHILHEMLGREDLSNEEAGRVVLERFGLTTVMDLPEQDPVTKHLVLETGVERAYRLTRMRLDDQAGRYLGQLIQVRDYTAEEARLSKEHYQATHDVLTDVYNRTHFYRKAKDRLAADPERAYSLVISNVRQFRLINDMFGMQAGDSILKQIGMALTRIQTPEMVIGRLESDHFAILIPTEDFHAAVFQKISNQLIIKKDSNYRTSMNFGIYPIEDREIPIPVMCERAALAIEEMNSAKGVSIAYYSDDMHLQTVRNRQLINDLNEGIRREQLLLYVQPQVALDGSVTGGEVLVRWQHPREGFLMPGAFIPVMEQDGVITRLDYYVWEHTCRILRRWLDEGYTNHYLSVNISPIDFYFFDLYEVFTRLVSRYELPPQSLRLEITESAVMQDADAAFRLLERLRDAGFIIEIDDFGSGYSSLNMLKDFPVDVLKVDMIFLKKSAHQERSETILRSVIRLAKDLQLSVITEGVETAEQAEALREMGTDLYQGFYFARPMPLAEFEEQYHRPEDLFVR